MEWKETDSKFLDGLNVFFVKLSLLQEKIMTLITISSMPVISSNAQSATQPSLSFMTMIVMNSDAEQKAAERIEEFTDCVKVHPVLQELLEMPKEAVQRAFSSCLSLLMKSEHSKIVRYLHEEKTITVSRSGPLVILYRGPHIPNTVFVEAIACLKLDMFILNCAAMDFDANCMLTSKKVEKESGLPCSPSREAYRKLLGDISNMNRTQIIALKNKLPPLINSVEEIFPSFPKLNSAKRMRRIPQIMRPREVHRSRAGSLDWSSNILTGGSMDSSIANNDVRIESPNIGTYTRHNQEVCGLKWSASGQHLASGGNGNLVYIWNFSSSQSLHHFSGHTSAVKALSWCPFQSNLLASGGGLSDQCIRFWNCNTGVCLNSVSTGSQVSFLFWSRNECELFSSHEFDHNQLTLWKYPSVVKLTELYEHTSIVLNPTQSPDGYTVASAATDETLFWNVFGSPGSANATGKTKSKPFADGGSTSELLSADDDTGPVTSIKWATNGRHIAVGFNNSEIQLWGSSCNKLVSTALEEEYFPHLLPDTIRYCSHQRASVRDGYLTLFKAALHVWKTIFAYTSKALKVTMAVLMNTFITSLASSSSGRRQVTGGELVRKLGERVLPFIIPILSQGLEDPDSSRRQVRIGLTVGGK